MTKLSEKQIRRFYLYLLGSGFSALVYEVLWARQLSLVLGGEILAISIITATFMAGLALGSALFGRISDRSRNPLRLYSYLEFGIGATALLFPLGLQAASLVFVNMSQTFTGQPAVATLTRLALSALLLLIPTTLMGGTLPVICRIFAGTHFSERVGRLYALNTAGAVCGCLLTGFFLIPHLGTILAGFLAVGINLAIGLFAWRQSQGVGTPTEERQEAVPPKNLRIEQFFLCGIVAITGALALGYEILWTRLFLLFLGNTTYAFTTILSIFLVGLSLGAWLYSRYLKRTVNHSLLLYSLCTLMAVYLVITYPFYDQFAYLFDLAHRWPGVHWWSQAGSSFIIVSLAILPPTIMSGALFPTAVQLFSPQDGHFGEGTGFLLFANTTGSILGSCIAGLYLIPRFGILDSFEILALVNIGLALMIYLHYRKQIKPLYSLATLVSLAFCLTLPTSWNQTLMSSAPYYYHYGSQGGLKNALTNFHRLIDYREGRETTVAIFEKENGTRYFRVNGKIDGGSDGDMTTQVLLGQLPVLFHPAPKDGLVIGLGTGITLAQVAAYDQIDVDCVEISPTVASIASHFDKQNAGALKKTNVELFIKDGRNLLLINDKQYDLIVSEPSNPWQAGNANLFTSEFYQIARSRLREDGIFCQWLPVYDLPPDSLRTAIATFLETFPDVLLFGVGGDVILLGRTSAPGPQSPWPISRTLEMPANNVLTDADLERPEQLVKQHLFADSKVLQIFSHGAVLNRDRSPQLEFIHQVGFNHAPANVGALQRIRSTTPLTASIQNRYSSQK
jgi:spermidine synthase